TTNRHGFANFELYLIDVEGKSAPVRVTYSKGFDGLPAFTPDGKQLAWTSNRADSGQSQLFLANWNHDRARELLGLDANAAKRTKPRDNASQAVTNEDDAKFAADARPFAESAHELAVRDFAAADIRRHVEYPCRDDLEGRCSGSR